MGASEGEVFEALGQAEAFLEFQERLSRAATVDRSVLLIGERGTGKELAATRLHYLSPRWKERLVTLNCAALAPGLIESELFGHEAGAFTGAIGRRTGRFEVANGGTLFLDEIGAAPVEVQEKILRVVEYGVFERVGSSQSTRVNVRLVAATNANLPALADKEQFKRDLLDRLSFEVLFVPPLRARREDIMLLSNHFAARMAHELGRADAPEFSEGAVAMLEEYPWPGNVRELKNVVERAVYRADRPLIRQIIFDPFVSPFAPEKPAKKTDSTLEQSTPVPNLHIEPAVHDLELRLLREALNSVNYNQRRAAEILGLTYHQFRGYYRKFHRELTGK